MKMLLNGFLFGLGFILAITVFIAMFSGIITGIVHLMDQCEKKQKQPSIFTNRIKEYERSNN